MTRAVRRLLAVPAITSSTRSKNPTRDARNSATGTVTSNNARIASPIDDCDRRIEAVYRFPLLTARQRM